ncbi:MAG: 16S rRNA (adenine(1518)-N(6)/adenine(1519)-N(6))-dimethyltransferase RsmA [Clostridiaceae bacterium]|nr:16S rRNA (adenine(1518)-N(6)/adenine(1519)-N(6))-dimethyltransferase RsmA [Clostridiaceae bacterium]
MMDLTSPAVVRELIGRYGFSFTKSLGQNFITSRSALDRMLDAAALDAETGVLEIGPGIGTLTRALSARAARVAAVEIDRALLPLLSETLADCGNVQVYHADALTLDLPAFCRDALPCRRLAVCANLPYYITTPAVTMLLESGLFSQITLLLQREAAERLCALPGEDSYCAVSAIVRLFAKPHLLFRVPADCFIPRPKVASAVLSLSPLDRGLSPEQKDRTLAVLRAAFAQRRKTLLNTLSAAALCDREQALSAIRACGFRDDVRGEALCAEDFIRLAAALSE